MAAVYEPGGKSFTWTLPQRLMLQRIINLVGPLREARMEPSQRPHRLCFGVDRFRDKTNLTCELRIAEKVIKELRGRGPIMKPSSLCGAQPNTHTFCSNCLNSCAT